MTAPDFLPAMNLKPTASPSARRTGLMGARPEPPATSRAGFLMLLAGSGLILLITFLEALDPNYSVHANVISDLLAIGTTTALIGEPAAGVLAVVWIAGAYELFRKMGRKQGFGVLNLLPGIGLLIAVLSPENVNVAIHSMGTLLGVIPGALVMLLSYRRVHSPFRYVALAFGLVSLVAIVIEFGAYNSPLVQDTLGPGGWERMIAYPLFLWLIGFGVCLMTPDAVTLDRALARPSETSDSPTLETL